VFQDLRYASRVLLQGKGWAAMVVLSLGLGIGANTTLFSATNGLLLRKLPVPDADRLVRLRHVGRNDMANNVSEYGYMARAAGMEIGSTFSYAIFEALRDANQTLSDVVAGAPLSSVNVVVDGHAEIATAYLATGNFERVAGVQPVIGRILTPSDDEAGAPPVATIGEAYWNRRFGGDPAIIGRVVHANNTPVTIVGVIPRGFTGIQRVLDNAPDLVFPLALDAQLNPQPVPPPGQPPNLPRVNQPTHYWLQIVGRLKPGITPQQVEGNLQGVYQQTARQGMASFLASLPESARSSSRNRDRTDVSRLSIVSAARGIYDPDPTTVRSVGIISAVVALILLLVCANIANLLLSRAAARQKEIAVRLSMGATRPRLVRQLLTESVLLALVGGAVGVLVAFWGRQLLPGAAERAPLDWRVLLFAAGISVTTGIIFGVAPALRVTSRGIGDVLKDSSRGVIGSRTALSRMLLVAQVAISIVLLIGAGLFLRTVSNLRSVDVGFNARNLVLFRVSPLLNGYDQPRVAALYDEMTRRLAALPGVRAVTLSNPPLLTGSVNSTWLVAQGKPFTPGPHNTVHRVRVAANFFDALQIPLLIGRTFSDRDLASAPKVAVINDAARNRFFPGEDPIGRRFGTSPETSGDIEIVGVVRDVKYNTLREPAPPTIYLPYQQNPLGSMAFEIRTAGDPVALMPAIRDAVRGVDANLPLTDMSTQLDQIERRFQQEQVFARAYTFFGGLALLVASIGLFGLMSYNVTRRTTEIGIRMALGAERQTVLQMVLRESLVLVAIGIAVGLVAAMSGGRFVASLLFGLSPTDLMASVVAIALMLAVAGVAGYLPARRASRLDPVTALRHE
jgi:predicted permease